MPTIIIINGFRFFFYSNENNEPPHIHVEKGDGTGKIWLEPIKIEYMIGFKPKEIKEIMSFFNLNVETFKIKWDEYFD